MRTTTLLAALVVVILIGGLVYAWVHIREEGKILDISTYEECVAAGYPVMESYPTRCATPDGRTFVNPDQELATTTEPVTHNGCQIGGCSAQLCGEAGQDLISNCEYRPEYACYQKYSTCERQQDGKCGWTPNSALAQCLADPPSSNAGAAE
jgi:hypothetical protein